MTEIGHQGRRKEEEVRSDYILIYFKGKSTEFASRLNLGGDGE